jgi:hypothetical protein
MYLSSSYRFQQHFRPTKRQSFDNRTGATWLRKSLSFDPNVSVSGQPYGEGSSLSEKTRSRVVQNSCSSTTLNADVNTEYKLEQ